MIRVRLRLTVIAAGMMLLGLALASGCVPGVAVPGAGVAGGAADGVAGPEVAYRPQLLPGILYSFEAEVDRVTVVSGTPLLEMAMPYRRSVRVRLNYTVETRPGSEEGLLDVVLKVQRVVMDWEADSQGGHADSDVKEPAPGRWLDPLQEVASALTTAEIRGVVQAESGRLVRLEECGSDLGDAVSDVTGSLRPLGESLVSEEFLAFLLDASPSPVPGPPSVEPRWEVGSEMAGDWTALVFGLGTARASGRVCMKEWAEADGTLGTRCAEFVTSGTLREGEWRLLNERRMTLYVLSGDVEGRTLARPGDGQPMDKKLSLRADLTHSFLLPDNYTRQHLRYKVTQTLSRRSAGAKGVNAAESR